MTLAKPFAEWFNPRRRHGRRLLVPAEPAKAREKPLIPLYHLTPRSGWNACFDHLERHLAAQPQESTR